MMLKHTLGTLGVWLTIDDDLVSISRHHDLAPRLISLCRALYRCRESGDTRRLIAPILEDDTSPLRKHLGSPQRMAALMNQMAGSLPVVRWMNAQDGWAELLECIQVVSPPTPAELLEQLRTAPQTAGLSADLLLDRLIESIEHAAPVAGERLLDAEQRAAVIEQSLHDLHRWADWHAPWRRALRLKLLPESTQRALCGTPSPAAQVLLSTPWQRTGRPQLPSQYLRRSRAPFQGCRGVLADLFRWCSSPEKKSFRLITGPSGSGKSRTAFELCQTLAVRGWTVGFLERDCTPQSLAELTRAGGDRLVVLDAAEYRQDTLQALRRQPHDSGRLRVVALSALSGWWTEGARTQLQPIPLRDRAPRLKIAAASYADATQAPPPRVLWIPEPEKLRWPIAVEMAGVLTVHRRPLDNIPARTLTLERQGWRRMGLDEGEITKRIIAQMLGTPPIEDKAKSQITNIQTMFDELLLSHLRDVPSALEMVHNQRAAMTTLCRLASNHPEASAWLSALIGTDPDTNVPTALALARSLAQDPASTPLGSILLALGVEGINTLGAPLWGLSIRYSRQAMDAPPRHRLPRRRAKQHHLPSPERPAATLDETLWETLRHRLDVLLPHHLQALDALQDPHQLPLATARLALIEQLARSPVCIELAINQLGMTLADPDAPTAGPLPSAADAAQAQELLHLLESACGLRDGPADALETVHDALAHLCCPPPSELSTLAQALHASGTIAGYASLLVPLQDLHQSRRPRWPHPDTLRIDLALHRYFHGLPHLLPPQRADHPPALRILRHTARILTGASIGSTLPQILAVLSGATAQQQPMKHAIQDAAARWYLEHGKTDEAHPLLLQASAGLEQLSSDRAGLLLPFVARSLHNLGARLHELDHDAAVDSTLSAADAWRRQARHSGEAFLPEFTSTLSNLGAMLSLSGCHEDAAALLRKGVSTCWGGMSQEALPALSSVHELLSPQPSPSRIPPEGLLLQEDANLTQSALESYTMWRLRELSLALTDAEPPMPIATPAQLRLGLADSLHNLGASLGSSGQLKPAIEATTLAAAVLASLPESDIKQAEALSNLSALKSLDGDHEGARSAAAAAVGLLTDTDTPAVEARARSNLAAALFALGCHQRAAQVAGEAAALRDAPSSTQVMALFNLGLARAATGELTEAIAALQAALSLRAPATPPQVLDCFQRLSAQR